MPSPTQSKKKVLAIVAFIALIALVGMLDVRRRQAEDQLKQLSVRLEQLQTGNTEQNREAAKQIVERVRKLIDIPEDIEPTVATIIDVETLRQRNSFYNKAENGDHLIVTDTRAILYDPDNNVILDVVPVQIQAPDAANQGQVQGGAASSKAAVRSVAPVVSSAAAQ